MNTTVKQTAQLSEYSQGYDGLTKTDKDGRHTLSLLIKGVHCALCIQKIESAVKAASNVEEVRLNFSTGRLNVVWDGDVQQADKYVQDIEDIGYKVFPYNPELERTTQDEENRFLLLCLGVAGFAMGNIMLLSVGLWSTDEATMGTATRNLMHWVSALIAIPVILFSGRPFFYSAFASLKKGQTNMDVPISIAIILAASISLLETFTHGEHVYFDSAIMLMFFLLIGRYLDFKARRNARSAATDLMQTLEGFANVIINDKINRMLISDLKPGMTVNVAAGEKIPIDGIIQSGETTLDTSLITGETIPTKVSVDDEVYAGTINRSRPITVKATKLAENSLLSVIISLMEKAEQSQAAYVRLADKAARLYTPVVHLLALCSFILWLLVFNAPWQDALLISITVLIITCPCALGLAVPVVQVLASGILMRKGVLLKSGDALERLACINTVFLDKTGTLTLGRPTLISEHPEDVLQLGSSLCAKSAHPLSKAILNAYGGKLIEVQDVKEIPGKGIAAKIGPSQFRLGKAKWALENIRTHDDVSETTEAVLTKDGELIARFHFSDVLREDAVQTINEIRDLKLDPIILSGDNDHVVRSIAHELQITQLYAEQTPVDKSEVLEKYKKRGAKILMVGDGLNDAPVLAGADISMAPGTAIEAAQNAADIIFMGDKLLPVLDTFKFARKSQKLIKQNFALAIAYNCIAVPLAFAGLVTPMLAAIAMSGSSLLVITNSYRLRFKA